MWLRQRRSKTLCHPLLICPPHTPTPRCTQNTTQRQHIRRMPHLLRHLRTVITITPR